jgi:hypothetical protein
MGPLCGSCEKNYAKNNLGACTYCEESRAFTYSKLIIYLVGIVLICTIMIKSALKNAQNMREKVGREKVTPSIPEIKIEENKKVELEGLVSKKRIPIEVIPHKENPEKMEVTKENPEEVESNTKIPKINIKTKWVLNDREPIKEKEFNKVIAEKEEINKMIPESEEYNNEDCIKKETTKEEPKKEEEKIEVPKTEESNKEKSTKEEPKKKEEKNEVPKTEESNKEKSNITITKNEESIKEIPEKVESNKGIIDSDKGIPEFDKGILHKVESKNEIPENEKSNQDKQNKGNYKKEETNNKDTKKHIFGYQSMNQVQEQEDRETLAPELADHKSAYYKIFVNFIQLVGIVRSLKIAWPSYLSNYLTFMKFLSIFSIKILTLGCLSGDNENFPFTFTEVLALNGIFIGFNVGICLFWFIRSLIYKIKIRRRIFISFLIIFDMIQPTLVSELANIFNCKEIDRFYYLENDLSISCDDDKYIRMAYYIFLPLLILWSFGLPFFLFYQLKKKSKRLFESSVYSTYGVYYSCYKPTYYYWDFLIMARENIVIFSSLLRINLVLRINIILILLFGFTYFQTTLKPYITEKMNKLEEYAIMISLYMIVLALYQVFQADEIYLYFATVIMVVLVILYLLLWLKEYMFFVKKDVRAFIKRNSLMIKEILKKGSEVLRMSRAHKGFTFNRKNTEVPEHKLFS